MEQDPSSLPVGGGGSLELWRPTGLVCLSEGPWQPWQDPGPFVSGGRAPAWGFPRGAVPCSPTPVSWLHSAVVGGSTEQPGRGLRRGTCLAQLGCLGTSSERSHTLLFNCTSSG